MIFILLLLPSVTCVTYQFEINKNVTASINPDFVLEKYLRLHQLFCLAECNSNNNCLSVTYSYDFSCILYKGIFNSSEIVASNDTNLYVKNSKKFLKKKLIIMFKSIKKMFFKFK